LGMTDEPDVVIRQPTEPSEMEDHSTCRVRLGRNGPAGRTAGHHRLVDVRDPRL
jgi:hypothetical protein